jgi:general stress protein 26
MSTNAHNESDVKDRLWSEIKNARYGMLGVVGGQPVQHFQPMTAFPERDTGSLWFFTQKDSDLARAAAGAAQAMFVVQAKDQDFQACIGGTLAQDVDRARIDKYWNPIVAAWFPNGKDDPNLTLLRLDASDAQVWLSEAGPVKFAYEIAKANMTHRQPDIGSKAEVRLGGPQ